MSKKYMIINTTIRKPRPCPNSGKDLRSMAEKKGYRIQWRDKRDEIRSVSPAEWGSNPVIVEELSDSLLNFVREGLIEIKPIDDIGDVLKDFSTKATAKASEPVAEPAAAKPEETAPPKKKRSQRRAKASEMSKANAKEVAAEKEEYPGAVNPDGPNNFTVTAKPKEKPAVAVNDGTNLDGATHAG